MDREAANRGTGLIGMAVAFNRLEIAALISVITFVTLRYVCKLKGEVE